MEVNIKHDAFPYNSETHIFELEESEIIQNDLDFLKPMFWGGYFDGHSIHIDKFLRGDLSINLEQLELAVIVAVTYLETVTSFDDPLVLYIEGLEQYYELRGITDKPKNMKEEYYVIKGIVDAVANNESTKPVRVEYATDKSNPSPR